MVRLLRVDEPEQVHRVVSFAMKTVAFNEIDRSCSSSKTRRRSLTYSSLSAELKAPAGPSPLSIFACFTQFRSVRVDPKITPGLRDPDLRRRDQGDRIGPELIAALRWTSHEGHPLPGPKPV